MLGTTPAMLGTTPTIHDDDLTGPVTWHDLINCGDLLFVYPVPSMVGVVPSTLGVVPSMVGVVPSMVGVGA